MSPPPTLRHRPNESGEAGAVRETGAVGAVGEAGGADVARPDPADIGGMAARLRVSATRLARLLRRQGDTGLSPSQISALTSIEVHGPMTLGALAEHERVAPPTITNVVAKLEDGGLVVRQPDARDRRVVQVSVTGAGAALLATVRARKDLWLAERLADLDDADRARLAAALDVIDRLTGRGSG
jgi:DNA-binding MarR family transcriptional regulator